MATSTACVAMSCSNMGIAKEGSALSGQPNLFTAKAAKKEGIPKFQFPLCLLR
jgi:hypothetical protein